MNEDFLKALHANMGGDAVGSFDDFKSEFQSNEEFQKAVHANMGGDKVGSFDEFKLELFGSGAKKKVNTTPSVRFAPMQEALLDAIGDVEATDYNVITGHTKENPKTFSDFSQHPNIVGVITQFGPSTAAGKYQLTKSTWDEVSKKLELKDFSPDSQRVAALYLAEREYKRITGSDIYADISSGKLENVRDALGGTGAATVWQGLQGDKEFASRFKSHLSRYEALKAPPEPKTIQEAAAGLESAMKDNTKVANDLQYNLNDTSVVETKNLPKDLASIKKELDDTRLNLKNTDHDITQKYHTRQEELRQNFEQTPVFQSINEKYSTQYNDEVGKFVDNNIKTNPEYIGLQQKVQDDLNSGMITSEEANQKINDYVSQIVDNEPTLKDFKTNVDKSFSDEYNQVFQGYVSKDDVLSSLLTQREGVFSISQAFQKQLMDAYNQKVNEYNSAAKSSTANQPKSSKEVGLPGGGPFAPGIQNKDYTGGLLKMNKTSRDYDKELKALPETTGFNKDAAMAAWYTDQKRDVPTQKSKELTKKATDYFEKGNQIKLKRYEALKEELFTMSPLEFGRQTVEDYTLKVQEYGDTERGYYEQDKAAIQGYIDDGLMQFKEDAGLKLSYKFGDKYDEFVKEEDAIGILIKTGKDVKDRIQAFQKEYSDILEDDDYLLANREIPKLYKAAKFEESQLADTYKQGERLSRVDQEQAYANANPVIASINSIIGKAVGAVVQSVGSILEQTEKDPNVKRVPGFAQLMGYVGEAGEKLRMAGGEMIAESPTSTMMQGQFFETYATTPTGKRVVYNDKGEVQYIRNEDGTLYEGFEAETIIDSAKGVKKENGYNPFSLVGQFIDVAAYMVPTIAMSAATSGAGAAAGMGTAGVNAMSKLGMFMGGYAQGYSSAKEEALKQRGLSKDKGEAFAVMSGLGAGVIENFNPIEGKIFTKVLPKNVIKENLVNLAAGKYTPYNAFENIAVNALKGGFKESVLEEVPQAFFETGLKNYYNQKKGAEFQSEISSDQWKDILITSFGMGAIADGVRSGSGSDLGKAALKTIVTNRDLYESYLTGMEKTSPEMAAKLRGEIDPLLTEIDAIDGLTPGRKEKSVELLYDIRTVESKLASITEPTLRKPYEEKLVELRKQLGKTVQVPTDAEGEPLEGEELQAVKQAAAQKKKDKEQKTQDNAIQEQETTEVPVQPETTSSGTNTQGQPQPKPEGATQQSQAQEQVQGEEVISDSDYNTFVNDNVVPPTIIETIAQKVKQNETLSLREQAILAEKGKDVESALKATQTTDEKVAEIEKRRQDSLSNINEITGGENKGKFNGPYFIQEGKFTNTYVSLQNTKEEVEKEINARYDAELAELEKQSKQSVGDTQTTQPTPTATEAEKVAPTPTAGAQTASEAPVKPVTKKDLKALTPEKIQEIHDSLPPDVARKQWSYGVDGTNSPKPILFYGRLVNAVGKVEAERLIRKAIDGTPTQQPTQVTPITKADTKLKKGADFSNEGAYEVIYNGEVIGRMYYDKERKSWSDPEYKPKDAYDIYGNNLGTKEEAIQAIVDRYNSKQPAATKTGAPQQDKAPTKEEIEQAVQKVDSTSINLLDEAISRAQKDLETETDPVKKEDIQQTINSLTKTRDQLSNSQTNKQTKDENKESSQSNGQGQRQDEKRGQGQENEVRGQSEKGNVTTNQQPGNESKSNESNKDEQGQEGQGEGQVGSTLAEEQGKGKGEEVDTLNKSIQAVIGKGAKGLSVDPKALLDYIEQNKIGKKKC